MAVAGTQSSFRKALGAIKDTTTVSLAKVNSDYKVLDINIVKATNHVERPTKEKYIRAVFGAISATRPRADVAYCIQALMRRLAKTHNWAVALKILIVVHRALRETGPTFQEELIYYSRNKGHMLNMSNFKDDSGSSAWDYSGWIRTYALFLEERLECFRVLKYDVETESPRTKDLDTPDLLDQLPALQQLLFRIVGCQPQGAAVNNLVIKLALSMVASESIRVYNAISDGIFNLVDKFFEMKRYDAQRALDIYRRALKQAERLSEFYEICKVLDVGRGERYIKIEQPPTSFIQSMEEHVRDAPHTSTIRKDLVLDAPKVIVAIENKEAHEGQEKRPPSPPPPEPETVKVEAAAQPPDLLGLNDPVPETPALDEKTSLALAIVPVENTPTTIGQDLAKGVAGWELALVAGPSSSEMKAASSKLAGGLDKLGLNSLYDDAFKHTNQNVSYNPWEQPSLANPMLPQAYDPFYASNTLAAATSTVQMAAMAKQQQALMLQQQQQMMIMNSQQPFNPFGNSYGAASIPYGTGMPVQPYNGYTGLI